MFSIEYRERITDRLVEKAGSDARVVSAAAIGSSAGGGDRWSDIDLTFGIADRVPVASVLTDWTQDLVADLDAAVLFDLPFRSTIYRVFLLPGGLQVDLSFAPAGEFGAHRPKFQLLFGQAVEQPFPQPSSRKHMFGLAVHHIVRARICIERERLWQAEFWMHDARDQALALACLRLGLETSYGRGIDDLPIEVRDRFDGTLVVELTTDELLRTLAAVTTGLLAESADILDEQAMWLQTELQELA